MPVAPPTAGALEDAGLAPESMVLCTDWVGRTFSMPISAIRIGDRVRDGPNTTTRVIGLVTLRGDMTTDAIALGPALVTGGTWVLTAGTWRPASGPVTEVHPSRWYHLYTESGTFMVGDLRIRDASDVGLDRLKPLVETVVLG